MVEDPKRHNEVAVFTGKKDLPQPDLGSLPPGYVIEFADIRELAAFEDLIAAEVDPLYDPVLWATRPKLRDLIRPPKFNGTIADIKLIVMEDPYERLLDAGERGWKMQTHQSWKSHRLTSSIAESLIPRYRGFTLVASPKSSRPGNLGQIQAELWYFPVPQGIIKKGTVRHKSQKSKPGEVRDIDYVLKRDYLQNQGVNTGKTINRVVTHPKMETERFIELDEASRRIGFDLLRKAMANPISTPMRD